MQRPLGSHTVGDECLYAFQRAEINRLVDVMRQRHQEGMGVVGDAREHAGLMT